MQAELRGPVDPLALHGELDFPEQRFALALHAPTATVDAWRLSVDEALLLRWDGAALELDGHLRTTVLGTEAQLASALRWSSRDGFDGHARLALDDLPAAARAEVALEGRGDLALDLRAFLDDTSVGGARGSLAADPSEGWLLELDLEVPLVGNGLEGWRLALVGQAGGTPGDPRVDASLALLGPVAAHGRLWLEAGAVRADLVGAGLTASARWDDAGGRAQLRLTEADVAAWLPWLEAPRLTAGLDARLGPEGFELVADAVRLRLPGGSLSAHGRVAPDGSLRATLRSDLDLADLRLGAGLSGRLSGPATLRSNLDALIDDADLSGVLILSDARLEGLPGRFDGDVQVTGAAADPSVELLLRADDGAEGNVRVQLSPRRVAGRMHADVRIDDVHVALRGHFDATTLQADGEVRVGSMRFEVRSRDDGVGISWAGDPTALEVHLTPAPWRLQLRADLERLAPAASGLAHLGLDWHDGLWPRLEGQLDGLALGPLLLGDWRLASDPDELDRWWAESPAGRLEASLADLTWAGRLRDLPLELAGLAGSLDVTLDGRGALADLDLGFVGEAGGAPLWFELAGRIDAAAGTVQATLDGSALDGALVGALERPSEGPWRGSVRSDGARLAQRPLALELSLRGEALVPQLRLEVALGEEARATLHFDAGQVDLEALLEIPGVGVLAADGALWPALDVSLRHVGDESGHLRLRGRWDEPAQPLHVDGAVRASLGPLGVGLEGADEGALRLRVTSPFVSDGWLEQSLPPGGLLDTVTRLQRDGLRLEGRGAVRGTLELALGESGVRVTASGLEADVAGLGVRLDAQGEGLDALDAQVRVDLRALDPHEAWWWPAGFASDAPLMAHVQLREERLSLEVAEPWSLQLEADLRTRSVELESALAWASPSGPSSVRGDLTLDPQRGLQGAVTLEGLRFGSGSAAQLLLEGRLRGMGASIAPELQLRARGSAVSARGQLPLPAAVTDAWGLAATSAPRQFDLRVAAFDLRDLPGVTEAFPYLDGVLAGSVAVRGERAVGQLVAGDLRLAERTLPLTITLSADLEDASAAVRLETGPSHASLTWRDGRLDALARLERFPLHALVEAVVGASDVSADVTGVLRAGWDPTREAPLDLRVGTELVRLERAGLVSRGRVAFDLSDGALRVQEAVFEGHGAWHASGELRRERIDLEVVAEAADFGPILGLVPALARYGVSAAGDLRLVASGSLDRPTIALSGQRLVVEVAGTSYELERGDVRLEGEDLHLSGDVRALDPLVGSVTLAGTGRLDLDPFELADLSVHAEGDLDVPFVGRLGELDAHLTVRDGGAPQLLLDGTLGAPFRVEGSLDPFDVQIVGRELRLAVPALFVGASVFDADLRARGDEGFQLSGSVTAREVRIDLGARAALPAPAVAPLSSSELAAQRAAQELVVFDGLRLSAPQRVTLAEPFGAGEAGFDLTLTGNAAEPRLEGSASALRGTFRFSGRDFEVVRAEAVFEPTRGVLPRVRVEARSQFEKARVLPPGSALTFAAPPGPRFEVLLAFDAEVAPDARGEFAFDVVPNLSSDALVEVAASANGLTAGTRALSELELLGLIALGRLEPGGGSAFAGAVAQTALDTAVDLLIVSELQAALSEALGLDVVEIRTTALGDLLGGARDPFGVSLRFGGYVSDELFASYRVGTFDDAERAFAFTNELMLTYELGPVALDLAGRLDFPSAAAGQPQPAVSAALRYGISRSLALEAGLDLRSERQTARLGVTLRW